jgi:DNA-binding GntR family transcriptional regulator
MREKGGGENETLIEFAYARIKEDITASILKPNIKVNLPELCERYKMSPTPIKQALNRLVMAGLVEHLPQRGYRIRRITWSEIDEIFEMRLMMENAFASKVIQSVNSNSVLQQRFESNLKDNLALARNFTTAADFLKTYSLDQQFHELFVMASGNHTALRMYKLLNTHAYSTYLYGKQPKEKTVSGILEHQCIYKAVKSGDVSELQRHLSIHAENAREIIYFSLKLANLL